MRDPGYISDAAWNQEHPYGDFAGYDLEQDQRWDRVAGSDFFPDDSFLPAVPGTTDRRVTSPSAAPATPSGRRGQPS